MTSDVSKTVTMLNDESLGDVKTFDDALALLADSGMVQSDAADLIGDGFESLDNKDLLINVPFVILDYKFSDNGNYGEFVIIRLMTQDNRKYRLTDGSTGILADIQKLARRNVVGNVLCRKGLTVSEYEYIDANNKKTPAKTYYIAQ